MSGTTAYLRFHRLGSRGWIGNDMRVSKLSYRHCHTSQPLPATDYERELGLFNICSLPLRLKGQFHVIPIGPPCARLGLTKLAFSFLKLYTIALYIFICTYIYVCVFSIHVYVYAHVLVIIYVYILKIIDNSYTHIHTYMH